MHVDVATPATPVHPQAFMLREGLSECGEITFEPNTVGQKSMLVNSWAAPSDTHGYVTRSPPSPASARAAGCNVHCTLRKGKWTAEEEAYSERIIHDFNEGLLAVPTGTTLRSYLSEKLNCDPMRITKKYTGSSCIGKRIFSPCERTTESVERKKKAQRELGELEAAFLAKLASSSWPQRQSSCAARALLPSSIDMPCFSMVRPVYPHVLGLSLTPSFGITRSLPSQMNGRLGTPSELRRSTSPAHRKGPPIRPVPDLTRSMSQSGLRPVQSTTRIADRSCAQRSSVESMMTAEVTTAAPAENHMQSAPRAPSAGKALWLSKDDHDACGLLLGFLHSIHEEETDFFETTCTNRTTRQSKTAGKAERNGVKRMPKATPVTTNDAALKEWDISCSGIFFPPQLSLTEKDCHARVPYSYDAVPARLSVYQACRSSAMKPSHSSKADDACNHAEDEAETSSTDYHTDTESSSSTDRGSVQILTPENTKKALCGEKRTSRQCHQQVDAEYITVSHAFQKRQRVDSLMSVFPPGQQQKTRPGQDRRRLWGSVEV